MTDKDLEMLKPYCKNDMRLLKRVSQSVLLKFSEKVSDADKDDFYSIANTTLWTAYNSYDPETGINFQLFLRSCLYKKFAEEIKNRHRQKRVINQYTVPLDATNNRDDEYSLLDIIPSDFDTFDEVIKRQDNEQYTDKVQEYISKLSNQQISILNLLIDGYKPDEIKKVLNISNKEYSNDLNRMRSYENVKVLF